MYDLKIEKFEPVYCHFNLFFSHISKPIHKNTPPSDVKALPPSRGPNPNSFSAPSFSHKAAPISHAHVPSDHAHVPSSHAHGKKKNSGKKDPYLRTEAELKGKNFDKPFYYPYKRKIKTKGRDKSYRL